MAQRVTFVCTGHKSIGTAQDLLTSVQSSTAGRGEWVTGCSKSPRRAIHNM
jgi:hypothetical protein